MIRLVAGGLTAGPELKTAADFEIGQRLRPSARHCIDGHVMLSA